MFAHIKSADNNERIGVSTASGERWWTKGPRRRARRVGIYSLGGRKGMDGAGAVRGSNLPFVPNKVNLAGLQAVLNEQRTAAEEGRRGQVVVMKIKMVTASRKFCWVSWGPSRRPSIAVHHVLATLITEHCASVQHHLVLETMYITEPLGTWPVSRLFAHVRDCINASMCPRRSQACKPTGE